MIKEKNMEFIAVYDFRNSGYLQRTTAKYVEFDDKNHDLYFVYEDGSRVSFIQNDYPIIKIEMLSGDDYNAAEVVLTMDEPNARYELPSQVSWIKWTVSRPARVKRMI